LLAVAVGVALVTAAFVLPHLNLGVRPRLDVGPERLASRSYCIALNTFG